MATVFATKQPDTASRLSSNHYTHTATSHISVVFHTAVTGTESGQGHQNCFRELELDTGYHSADLA